MAVPLIYNVLSLRARWTSTLVAVLGIAGTVGVFVAMLALAKGFEATLVASGSPGNAMVQRAGSTSEMASAISIDQVRVIENAPGVLRDHDGPLVSAEVVVIAPFQLKNSTDEANIQIRGVSPRALAVRSTIRMVAGRFVRPGVAEIVVGRNAASGYKGFDLGNTLRFGGAEWRVVGWFDAGGNAFDSEVWCDADVLNQVYQRPRGVFQSITAHLQSEADLATFERALTSDPRLTVQVQSEVEYYAKQSRQLTTLITVLGTLVAAIMGIGAIVAALNTMYAAVAERSREIATLRALGFGAGSIVLSFVVEALVIAFVGGVVGCIAILPINGLTTGTLNWQTFSHLAFAFRITPGLLVEGILFALLMGVAGGVPPAIRAARQRVSVALREL